MSDIGLDRYGQADEEKFAKDTLRGERALIGAAIIDNSLMKHATEHLLPTSFNVTRLRPIFLAMIELHKRQAAISTESLVNELRAQNQLHEAGGEEYVKSLDKDVPFRLTAEQHDYVDRFILMTIGQAGKAAALSGDMSASDVANIILEKTQKLRELRGWPENPLIKKSSPALESDTGEID